MPVTVLHGDMLDALADLEPASIDAVVCDPPYGLAFMGKGWDHAVPGPDYWAACLRVLKPGAHLLAFGGTRTAHRLACAIEDAGFEIRDTITWHYGSGFPKSLDVSKAIDATLVHGKSNSAGIKAANASRPGEGRSRASTMNNGIMGEDRSAAKVTRDEPQTDAARQWQGWGTALKPASEPIIVARKPLGGTVVACVLEHGTGALNIDGTRVQSGDKLVRPSILRTDNEALGKGLGAGEQDEPTGRWPTNVVFTHALDCGSEEAPSPCVDGCPVAALDAQSGVVRSSGHYAKGSRHTGAKEGAASIPIDGHTSASYADSGGASRFFPTFRYQAKAPTRERPKVDGVAHPTVKPLALMRWLVRLVTPPGGAVLDPFAGSGATGEAAALEGMRAILVERDETYLPLIEQRIARARAQVAAAPVVDELSLFTA